MYWKGGGGGWGGGGGGGAERRGHGKRGNQHKNSFIFSDSLQCTFWTLRAVSAHAHPPACQVTSPLFSPPSPSLSLSLSLSKPKIILEFQRGVAFVITPPPPPPISPQNSLCLREGGSLRQRENSGGWGGGGLITKRHRF